MKKIFILSMTLLSIVFLPSCENLEKFDWLNFTWKAEEVIPPTPIDVFLAQDMTGSREQNGIPELTEDHLDQLISILIERGGRLAFMVIDFASKDEPIVDVKIRPIGERPQPPKKSTQAATQQKNKRAYEKALRTFVRDSTANSAKRDKDIQTFKSEVLRRIAFSKQHPPKGTDIMSALNTASMFLNNEDSDASPVALFLSDGIDNRKGMVAKVPNHGVEFVWVSGVPIPDQIPQEFRTAEVTTINDAFDYIKNR